MRSRRLGIGLLLVMVWASRSNPLASQCQFMGLGLEPSGLLLQRLRGGGKRGDDAVGVPEDVKGSFKPSKRSRPDSNIAKSSTRKSRFALKDSEIETTMVATEHEDDDQGRIARLRQATGGRGAGRELGVQQEMVMAVEQLHAAIARKDKKNQQNLLNKIAKLARKKYAKKIFDVKTLETDGMAVGGSVRQRLLRRSTTATAKNKIEYDGKGKVLVELREGAKILSLPNPTDEAIGIDEHTELRMALERANETRVLPVQIKNNRELSKVAKAAIGDMLVPEDVAVKWWLVKKREKAAQKSAYIDAKRRTMIKHFAAMLYVMAKQRSDAKGRLFDAAAAEVKALKKARYHYEIQPIKEERMLVKAARKAGISMAPAIVKPKGQKRVSIIKRKGPRRALPKKKKVVKRIGKTKKSKDGTGSQRKKRSGLSGGKNGKSRFKKRKG